MTPDWSSVRRANPGRTFRYAVLDVCASLHAHHTGSLGGMSDERYAELVEWLGWRTHEAWEPSTRAELVAAESLIRGLAWQVLSDADRIRRSRP